VDITVYLPDGIGKRAKDAGLPFSRLLRDAVATQLDYRDTLAEATGDMTSQEVDTTNGDRPVRLRFTGRQIASDGETTVYQTDGGKIVVTDSHGYDIHGNAEDFGAWMDKAARIHRGSPAERVLADAAETLGLPEVIRL
jgi:hypothetical protein